MKRHQLSFFDFWFNYEVGLFCYGFRSQQIHEKHAEKLCHVYICVNDNPNATEKHPDCKNGHKMTKYFYKSVANAARLLCCEILRYEGNVLYFS